MKYTREQYIAQAIQCFTLVYPPIQYVKDWLKDEVDEDIKLQEWVVNNRSKQAEWMTGISIIEACIKIVDDARSNDNIKFI